MKKWILLILALLLIAWTAHAWMGVQMAGPVVASATPTPTPTPGLLSDANVLGVWYFDNDATDSSDANNDLTANGGPTYVTSGPTPQQGTHCAALDSSSAQYYSNTSIGITGQFTYGGWFSFDSAADFIVGGDHSGTNYGWQVKRRANGRVEFGISSDGTAWNSHNSTATPTASSSTWYHIVVVYDGSYKRIYVNSTEVSDGTYPVAYSSGVNNSTADFEVGRTPASTTAVLDGNADEVFLFSRALTPTEISDIYTGGF